jgi:hypothetical protein
MSSNSALNRPAYNVEGHRRRFVTEHLLHDLRAHPRLHSEPGGRVPQVLHPQPGSPARLHGIERAALPELELSSGDADAVLNTSSTRRR